MRANNRAATVPTILPALSLLLVAMTLVAYRPAFMRPFETAAILGFNLIALASTFVWQRRIQGEIAVAGYDAEKVRTLIATNWIRTAAHLGIAILAMRILLRVLDTAAAVAP